MVAPVGGHVDHGPLVLSGGGEDLAGAAAQDRVTVVGVLPVAVGVVDDQFQGPVRAGRGPLEHGQVAVGVPGGHDRSLPDVPVNRAGLLRAVVDDSDFGGLDEFGAAVADAELGFPDAADHPVRRQAVAIGRPGPHEVGAAAGEDPAGEAVTVQHAEQFHHRLVHRRRIRPPEARVPGRRQPAPAHGVELVGSDASVGKGQQLDQGFHPARVQLFQAGGMAQLGGAVQCEDQLGVHGLFRPQRAVIVEHRDAVPLGDEVRRIGGGHGGDELYDRLLGGRLTPARQLIGAHCPPPRLMLDLGPDRLITCSVGGVSCRLTIPSG